MVFFLVQTGITPRLLGWDFFRVSVFALAGQENDVKIVTGEKKSIWEQRSETDGSLLMSIHVDDLIGKQRMDET